MTAQRDLKRIIRQRRNKTGESGTAVRAHVICERDELLGRSVEPPVGEPPACVEAAVLKVNQQSVRARILGESGEVTYRTADVRDVVPGHIVTLRIARRWTWRGDAYASGSIEEPRIDVASLGLEPLTLEGGELEDVASCSEPYRDPDPYAPRWRMLTAGPRPAFEFDAIAWGQLPGRDAEDNPTCDAAELAEVGDRAGARALLMDALGTDLRCLDAHAHLGNLEFERNPERATLHYEIGIRIGELSLPPGFEGLLSWGRIYNRPFLRCLHGQGLCLWRFGRLGEAKQVFERLTSFDPNDSLGAWDCWLDIRAGRTWQESWELEEAAVRKALDSRMDRDRL